MRTTCTSRKDTAAAGWSDVSTDHRGPVAVVIRPDPAAQAGGISAQSPSTFVVAEPLPGRCSRHGRGDVTVRLPIEAKFAEPNPESQQLTLVHDVVDGPHKGKMMSALREPAADAVVTAEWPSCPSCLSRIRLCRWTGRAFIAIAVISVVVFLAVLAAPVVDRSFFTGGSRMLFYWNTSVLLPAAVFALIAARGAFSSARPIPHARLDENRARMIVSAAHPEFVAALDDLRAQKDRTRES